VDGFIEGGPTVNSTEAKVEDEETWKDLDEKLSSADAEICNCF
jgi:hypothetical protein